MLLAAGQWQWQCQIQPWWWDQKGCAWWGKIFHGGGALAYIDVKCKNMVIQWPTVSTRYGTAPYTHPDVVRCTFSAGFLVWLTYLPHLLIVAKFCKLDYFHHYLSSSTLIYLQLKTKNMFEKSMYNYRDCYLETIKSMLDDFYNLIFWISLLY